MTLEMVPTSTNVLGIDIPKGLPNYRETVMPSKVTTFWGTIDWVWVRTRGDVSKLRSLAQMGLGEA